MASAYVIVEGNLGGDPEMRYTPTGRPVTQFSVAVNNSKKNQQTGEWEDGYTAWYRASVWGDAAERAAEQLTKGTRVLIRGRLAPREYDGREGDKRISLDVNCDHFVNFGKRPREEGEFVGAPRAQAAPNRERTVDDDLDDLPF